MTCPVCNFPEQRELLKLEHWPLFQHPVPASADVEPIYCDIDYLLCNGCVHSFQKAYRPDLLEQLYRYHYYAPGSPHLGYTFRRQFAAFYREVLADAVRAHSGLSVLEIGSSSGEMLVHLRELFPGDRYVGFEPNLENAATARAEGFEIEAAFFNASTASRLGRTYDVVYSRHVIEHVAVLDEFLTSITTVSNDETRLILETPSLEYHLEAASLEPFHIEHLSVFSLHSLAMLARRFGWGLMRHTCTPAGNIIAAFRRGNRSQCEIPRPDLADVSAGLERLRHWREVLAHETHDLRVLIWGAGSYGRKVVDLSGRLPEMFLDGNPAKAGRRFVGLDIPIRHAPVVVDELVRSGEDRGCAIIIASTYFEEIEQALRQSGWSGKVITVSRIS